MCDSVDDTLLQINSEIWMAELAFYSSVKEAARRGANGAKFIADDLGERFPKGRRNGGGGANSPEPVGNQ